jgi:hypothetical protein
MPGSAVTGTYATRPTTRRKPLNATELVAEAEMATQHADDVRPESGVLGASVG